MLSDTQFESYGPKKIAEHANTLAGFLAKAAIGPAKALLEPASGAVKRFADQQRRVGNVLAVFVPFTSVYHYVFRCDNVRHACARMPEADRRRIGWNIEEIDWRQWFLEVHMPGLERFVFPQIDERVRRPRRAPQRHETLTALLDEMAIRHDLAIALQRAEPTGLPGFVPRWSGAHLRRQRARRARRRKGDRLLAADNTTGLALAFFGSWPLELPSSVGRQVRKRRARSSPTLRHRTILCARSCTWSLATGSTRGRARSHRHQEPPAPRNLPRQPGRAWRDDLHGRNTGKTKGVELSHQN